jgi:hypothetical protein
LVRVRLKVGIRVTVMMRIRLPHVVLRDVRIFAPHVGLTTEVDENTHQGTPRGIRVERENGVRV